MHRVWTGRLGLAAFLFLGAVLAGANAQAFGQADTPTDLNTGWQLHTGCKLEGAGAQISSDAFKPSDWISVTAPSTVLAAQVAAGQFKDPYFGMNLRSIPGTSYAIGKNFSNLPMPADSPYACDWWYRKTFSVPAAAHGKRVWLHFAGINYRANIWLNGKLVATDRQIAGAYRTYDLNATGAALPGQANVLAVQVYAPKPEDLGINWVDWSPAPPDKDMGLTGPVTMRLSGAVKVASPLVTTHFVDADLSQADLTVYAEVTNAGPTPVTTTVSAELLGRTIQQQVALNAGEHKTVTFAPEQFPQLHVKRPQVWWPYQMGTPHLENLRVRVAAGGSVSDEATARFGIREVTSELTANKSLQFHVNGKPVMIRGGGWSQDMMLRDDPQRLANQFALVRDLHLNTIRLEGKLESDEFYKLADEQGVLVMAGWCCCDRWERWKQWSPENYTVAAASLRSQMLRLRSHPSLLVWLNGSDNPPIPFVEQAYLNIEKEMHWPNPTISSASGTPTTVSGVSGVKMTGPYDYVAPYYWYADKAKYGGAYRFNTETSPGPAIPNPSSLRQFLPADQISPNSPAWSYHNGSGHFAQLTVFDTSMRNTYGEPHSFDEYQRYAQAMAYDGERAMFEAYSRERYRNTTGVVQWMLNNAWPSNIWHLYDYYLNAAGGYYGARKANEPLHVQYSYDDHSIVLINNDYKQAQPVHVTAHVYDLSLKQQYTHEADFTPKANSSERVFTLPGTLFPQNDPGIHFIELALTDAHGNHVSDNFYWIPSKLTQFNWKKTDFTHTPASSFENLKALAALPAAHVTAKLSRGGAGGSTLTLHNDSQALAFLVNAQVFDAAGHAINPAFWSDNYVSLFPGESRTLTVHLASGATDHIGSITVAGWNVPAQTIGTAHAVEAKASQQ